MAKQLKKERLGSADREALKREIEIHSKLSHENIIGLRGNFSDARNHYLVLDLVENGSLFSLNKGIREVAAIHSILLQICKALEFLHSLGYVHRDIKLENVLMGDGGRALLADFGFCAKFGETHDRKTFCGTNDYLAPEIRSWGRQNEKVDVWCLGILTFELFEKKVPFNFKSNQEFMKAVRERKIPFGKEFPLPFKNLVLDCLEVNPSDRPSAKRIVEFLEGLSLEKIAAEIFPPPSTQDSLLPTQITVIVDSSPKKPPERIQNKPEVFPIQSKTECTPNRLEKNQITLDFTPKKVDLSQIVRREEYLIVPESIINPSDPSNSLAVVAQKRPLLGGSVKASDLLFKQPAGPTREPEPLRIGPCASTLTPRLVSPYPTTDQGLQIRRRVISLKDYVGLGTEVKLLESGVLASSQPQGSPKTPSLGTTDSSPEPSKARKWQGGAGELKDLGKVNRVTDSKVDNEYQGFKSGKEGEALSASGALNMFPLNSSLLRPLEKPVRSEALPAGRAIENPLKQEVRLGGLSRSIPPTSGSDFSSARTGLQLEPPRVRLAGSGTSEASYTSLLGRGFSNREIFQSSLPRRKPEFSASDCQLPLASEKPKMKSNSFTQPLATSHICKIIEAQPQLNRSTDDIITETTYLVPPSSKVTPTSSRCFQPARKGNPLLMAMTSSFAKSPLTPTRPQVSKPPTSSCYFAGLVGIPGSIKRS